MIPRTEWLIRLSLIAALSVLLHASPADTIGNLDGFDAFMAKAMQDFKVPGAAVAVIKDGKILLVKSYGYRDTGKKVPITGKTLFPIASITKSFTVTALGTLVDQGRLEWDKPVREYLPGFRMYDPVATEQLTARDLVTHRSGLPRHDLLWYSSSFTREQLVARLRYLEPNKPLRSTFQYNNLMFVTAGYLGGQIAGTSWEELVQQRILDPLGMSSTRLSSQEARKSSDYALPYRKNRKTDVVSEIDFSRWGDVGPAGSMNSCIEDMASYLLLQVNKGNIGGKQLLGSNTSEQMQSPQMVIQSRPLFTELGEASYGMGFIIDTYRGHKHVSHGGNLDGFSAQLSFLPNDGIGVVVLTNLDGTFLRDLVPYHAYDQMLGLDRIDWVQRFLEIERKAKDQELTAERKGYTGQKPGTHPSHEMREYEGNFEHPGYGKISIRLNSKASPAGLQMTLNDVERPLEHFHYDTFQVPANPLDPFEKLRLTFPTDPQAELSTLAATLEANAKPIVFTRVAEQQLFETTFLRRFVGEYDAPGLPWTVALAGENSLQLQFPGAPPRKLIPRHGTRFDVEDMTGVSLEFKQDTTGATQEVVLYTPDTVLAIPKKK
jgi:CubicO group peptidase (beta-lactamase class C family)